MSEVIVKVNAFFIIRIEQQKKNTACLDASASFETLIVLQALLYYLFPLFFLLGKKKNV